jgi:chromosome partitioning protein
VEEDTAVALKDAAQQFGVKLDRLRRAAWDGRLRAVRVGGQWLVRPAEVERFLQEKGRQATTLELAPRRAGPGRGRIIAVAIPKGGTGKTTTTLNLGAALAELGERVLLVDFDPQASLTIALGLDPLELKHTVYTAIKDFQTTLQPCLDPTILHTPANVDLVPASIALNLANAELIAVSHREHVLQRLLAPVRSRYDFILIDTLPYLGILVENALVAADEVIIPCQAQLLSRESGWLMLNHVQRIRTAEINPQLRVCGILLTQVNHATLVQRQLAEDARMVFSSAAQVFRTTIDLGKSVQESQALQQTLFQYHPNGPAARAYRALAQEVLHAA